MVEKKQAAFIEAYQSCHDAFVRYCSALAYSKMDMEDLVQDVLLSAYIHFEQIKKKDQLLHYLIRAARNKAISIWRKRKYRTELLEKHTNQLLAQGVLPDTIVDIQLMYQALEQLPEKQRNALILFEISGFSMKEIAQLQNSTEGAVKTKISRGRKKLRHLMKDKKTPLVLLGLLGATITNAATTNILFTVVGTQTASSWTFSSFFQNKSSFFPKFIGGGFNLNMIIMSTFSIAFLTISLFIFLPKEETGATAAFSSLQQQPIPVVESIPTDPIIPIVKAVAKEKPLETTPTKKAETFPRVNIETTTPVFPKRVNIDTEIATTIKTPLNTTPISKVNEPNASEPFKSFPAQKSVASTSSNAKTTVPKDGCEEKVKFRGDAKSFKKDLLNFMKKDGLITSKKDKHTLSFDGKTILLNKKPIRKDLQGKYLMIFGMHNILPCPNRIIETTAKYIAVGDITSSGFQGSMYGIVDLDELNDYSKGLK